MSWLSHLKNNIIHALADAVPTPAQQPVHQAASNVANAVGSFLNVMEGVAEQTVAEAVASKLGPAAAVLEYDFLHQLIAAATTRQSKLAQPTPTDVSAPATIPAPSGSAVPLAPQ